MSLINDALKKAQKQRTGDTPTLTTMPGVGGESAARIAKRDKPAGINTQLLRLALGAGGLLVVLVIGGFFLFRSSAAVSPKRELRTDTGLAAANNGATPSSKLPASGPAQVSGLSTQVSESGQPSRSEGSATGPGLAADSNRKPATATSQVSAPKSQVSGLKSQVSEASSPPITFRLPAVAPVAHEPESAPVSSITATAGSENIPLPPAPATAVPTSSDSQVSAPTPATAKSQVSAPEPAVGAAPGPSAAADPAKMPGKAIDYIENLHIAGVRASATDAKVLMNDRVYRVGDIVERKLGLRLTGITANSLSFEDEHGAPYTRNF